MNWSKNHQEKAENRILPGIGVGVAIGVAFGAALENLALGIGVGIAIGASIATTQRKIKDDTGSEE